LGAAIAYTVTPIDLIPDWIPLVGHLDDLLVVPGLAWSDGNGQKGWHALEISISELLPMRRRNTA
jgi:hypothetical protein